MDILKALVVDDKIVLGDLFEFTLGARGHKITVVNTAKKALAEAAKEKFDIAFVDIIMPEGDGIFLLKKLKELVPDMPVVMMSGFSLEEQKKQALHLGAVTCLKKPFQMEDVRKAVKLATGKDI